MVVFEAGLQSLRGGSEGWVVGKVLIRGQVDRRRVRGCALASASILSLVVMNVAAKAQPAGGSVVAGQAQISASGATTLINQSTSKAIINWQSFSVGQGGTVQFNQPSSSAITLNRVTGASASTIDGAIRANGQVWLLNANGLLFGNGATINVGGLLATTSDIADQDFLGGRYNFSSTSGKGSITNAGAITAANGGSVVLSSPNVVNKGLIAATAGHVVLGGTDTFTVDFAGDHLLSYALGANSSGGQVSNSGKLAAAGGTVLMTARAAAGVQDAVINNTGMVEATSVRQENGEIILEADNGTVSNSGTLDASGKATGETGGTVQVLGQQVAVADGAKIDVSGDAGGGTALIGGNSRGQGPEINAQNTTIGKASINASAITSGNGGKVVVYSTGNTTVAAAITATGGITSGKGGTVETSGHVLGIATAATVNTAAPHGTPGDWLLDPDNITIQTGGLGLATGQTFSTSGAVTIDPLTIVTALVLGNVTLQANQDITVNSAISTTTTNTLELDAGHSIILNAGISLNFLGSPAGFGSTLILSANDPGGSGNAASASITQSAGTLYSNDITLMLTGTSSGIGSPGSPLALDYSDSGLSTLSLTVASGNSVYLTSQSDHTEISAAGVNVGSNTFSLVANVGPILQAAGGSITAGTINLQTTVATGEGGIGGTGAAAGTPINVAAPSGTLALTLATNGDLANINSTSAIALGAVNLGATGNFSLTSSGNVTQAVGTALTANALNVSTSGGASIALNNAANQVTGLVTLSSGNNASLINTAMTSLGTSSAGTGTLVITSGGLLTVLGDLSGNQVGLTATGGSITETTGLITTNSLIANASANVTLAGPNNVVNAILYGGALSVIDFVTTGALTLGYAGGNPSGIPSPASSVSINAGGAIIMSAAAGSEINAQNITLTSGGSAGIGGIIQIDDGEAGDNVNLSLATAGNAASVNALGAVTLNSVNLGASGNFTLGAAGLVTQINPITSADLNVTTTGTGNTITLTSTSNAVSGTARFNAAADVTYINGSSISTSTLGSSSVNGTLSVNIMGPALDLTDTSGQVSATNVLLTAGNFIDQAFPGADLPIVATNLNATVTNASTGSLQLLDSSGSLNNAITGTVLLNAGVNGDVGFSNTKTTNLDVTGTVASVEVDAIDPSGMTTPGINLSAPLQASSSVQLNASGDIQSIGGDGITAPSISFSSVGGSIGSVATAIPLAVSSGALTLSATTGGGDAIFNSSSPVIVGAAGINAPGGVITLFALGGITVNGPVMTLNQQVTLDASGSIAVNANITAEDSFNAGAIALIANDPNIGGPGNSASFTSDTNNISGAGTMTASTISLNVNQGSPDNVSGGIGFAGAPLHLDSLDSNVISLSVGTYDGDVYLAAAKGVSLDAGSQGGINLTAPNAVGTPVANFTLTAAGPITQTFGVVVNDLNLSTTGSGNAIAMTDVANPDNNDPGNLVSGTVRFNTASGSDVSYTSVNSVVLGNSNVGGALDIEATGNGQAIALNDTGGNVTVGGLLTLDADTAISQSIPITAFGLTAIANLSDLTLAMSGNNITGTVALNSSFNVFLTNAGATNLATSSAGGSINISSGSITVTPGSTITAGTNSSLIGNVLFTTVGDMTINGSINTSGANVNLDTGRTIFVNSSISSTANGSGPGTIVLTANDPSLPAGNADGNGIFGGGTLTAATINLQAGGGANGLSGSIGTAATTPLLLTSDTGALSLAVRSFNGNVYLSSAVPVSIDPGVAANVNGIDTQGSNGFYGEVFLTASGPITQTYGIQSGILTLTATGPDGAIALTDTGASGDPGNSVFGQVHLNSTTSAAYSSGFANNMGVNLGASTIGGNLVVISSNGDLDVQDPNGGAVQVTGTTTLSAGSGDGISISSPLISGSGLSLIADQNISQSSDTGDAHIQTGGVLLAQSASGSISLTDPGNQVGAIAVFNAAGNVVFQASSSLTLASVTATSGGIKIESGGDLTIESGSVLTSGQASGYSILLSAGGNFINDAGPNALSMSSGATFAIFSATPAGDVFGNLNSGNTAFWNTTYANTVGTNPGNLGNRYVFAVQPTLTVSADSASKVYGVDDSASLQAGFTVSGLQPGVAGVYLADTVSSVLSTAPQLVSAGSAATANVGTYTITPSNLTLANAYIPAYGYAVVAQNGTLTVTPATLSYLASAVSRTYGSANPTFGGTVTGFLNTDTLVSATGGTLSFTSTATAASPVGSYTITGSGLSATNYVFVQAAGNASALTIMPVQMALDTSATTQVLTSFTVSTQLPLLNPVNTPVGASLLNPISLPVVPSPPPPPPPPDPPPVDSPLTDLSDTPNSSDQTTSEVASSLDHASTPPAGARGAIVIPQLLATAPPPPPPPTDLSALPSFGNSSLWQ
jgi:filamentous hemagglutinin family protein